MLTPWLQQLGSAVQVSDPLTSLWRHFLFRFLTHLALTPASTYSPSLANTWLAHLSWLPR